MSEIVAELRSIANERRRATADEENKALFVVARLSRQDASLMDRAAAAIEALMSPAKPTTGE